MKKTIIITVILSLFCITENYAKNIIINIYVIGLDQPIKRIVSVELKTQEQLDEVIHSIELEFILSQNFGTTPLYALIDHMLEDLNELNIPSKDAKAICFLFSDGVNTDISKGWFKSENAKMYANNKKILENIIIENLNTPVNEIPIKMIPVVTLGRNKDSNMVFLNKICSPNERVYRFNEESELFLIKEKLMKSIEESETLILNIGLDHSSSMQTIVQKLGELVIQLLSDVFQKANKNDDIDILLSDFIDFPGGPSYVASKSAKVRPDEVYFSFDLSPFRIMRTPILQKHYRRFLLETEKTNYSKILGPDYPQTNITYNEILQFIIWLNSKWEGPGKFRLPTEFELENLLRLLPSGFSRGEPLIREYTSTWYSDYDITEKVDPKGSSSGTHKIVRGSSYEDTDPMMNRPEYRGRMAINDSSALCGFRLVLTID